MVGGTSLRGEVAVVGAKNGALKLMAGALLAVGTTRLTNVPAIVDVTIMAELLRRLGCTVDYDAGALAAAGTPVLVVHGTDDEVVIVQQGRSAARYLERHGVAVRYVEPPGGHHLGPEAVDELGRWLDG